MFCTTVGVVLVGSNPSPATLQKRPLTSGDAGQGPMSCGLSGPRFVKPLSRVDLAVGNGCDLQKRQSHEMAAVAGMRLRKDSGAESVAVWGR